MDQSEVAILMYQLTCFQRVTLQDCRYNAHKKCSERVPRDCTGEVPTDEGIVSEGSLEEDRNDVDSDEERNSPEADDGTPIVTPSNFSEHLSAQTTHSNIPVQRLVQSVKQVTNQNTYILSIKL